MEKVFKENEIENKSKKKLLLNVLNKLRNQDGALMPILQNIQSIYGYLPFSVLTFVGEELDISLEEIYSVATFYNQFKFSKVGKYQISICLGTVCYVKGANDILEEITNILGIKSGEITPDGKFSIDTSRCIGCCGMSPAITINNKIYGNVKKSDVKKILEEYI